MAIQILSDDKKHLIVKDYSADSKAAAALEKLTGFKVKGYKAPLAEGSLLKEVVETKKAVITEDISWIFRSYSDDQTLWKLAPVAARLTKAKCGMGVPLLAGETVVGVIGCGSVLPLRDADARRLANFGAQAGLAIEHQQRYEALEKRTKELKESEEKYRLLFEDSIEGIALSKGDRIFSANKALLDMLGYESLEEYLKVPLLNHLAPESLEKAKTRMKKRETGGALSMFEEMKVVRTDGEIIDIELSAVEVSIGGESYVQTTIRDITERKHADEKIKKYSARLEESNRLKDVFIDILRHDLLNPVSTARNMARLAMESESDPKKKRIQEIIFHSSLKMIDMIENASLLATLESDGDLQVEERDLAIVLKWALEDVESLRVERGCKIISRVEGGTFAAVNPLISDVFLNLLSNGLKYSPEGSEVIVDALDEGSFWRVSVADSGNGILDVDKDLIFNRFKRIDKGGVQGTGLGLAIVKKIVEAHGGRVWVEDNHATGGSVFFFTVPK